MNWGVFHKRDCAIDIAADIDAGIQAATIRDEEEVLMVFCCCCVVAAPLVVFKLGMRLRSCFALEEGREPAGIRSWVPRVVVGTLENISCTSRSLEPRRRRDLAGVVLMMPMKKILPCDGDECGNFMSSSVKRRRVALVRIVVQVHCVAIHEISQGLDLHLHHRALVYGTVARQFLDLAWSRASSSCCCCCSSDSSSSAASRRAKPS